MCGRYVITKPVEKTVKIVKSSTTVTHFSENLIENKDFLASLLTFFVNFLEYE